MHQAGEPRFDVRHCDHLVVSYGNWQLGHPGGRRDSDEELREQLRTVKRALQLIKKQSGAARADGRSVGVLYLGNFPFSQHHKHHHPQKQDPSHVTDWRQLWNMRALNAIAREVFDDVSAPSGASGSVPMLDVFDALLPVFERAPDGEHLGSPHMEMVAQMALGALFNATATSH